MILTFVLTLSLKWCDSHDSLHSGQTSSLFSATRLGLGSDCVSSCPACSVYGGTGSAKGSIVILVVVLAPVACCRVLSRGLSENIKVTWCSRWFGLYTKLFWIVPRKVCLKHRIEHGPLAFYKKC